MTPTWDPSRRRPAWHRRDRVPERDGWCQHHAIGMATERSVTTRLKDAPAWHRRDRAPERQPAQRRQQHAPPTCCVSAGECVCMPPNPPMLPAHTVDRALALESSHVLVAVPSLRSVCHQVPALAEGLACVGGSSEGPNEEIVDHEKLKRARRDRTRVHHGPPQSWPAYVPRAAASAGTPDRLLRGPHRVRGFANPDSNDGKRTERRWEVICGP